LGWIAERYPQLVRAIVDQGHELASHGYGHQRASDLSREQFHDDITRAKGLLEDIGGVAVRGYRAPSFSIGSRNLWALDTLRDAGHIYSSSIYPIAHDHYGMPEAPRFAFHPLDDAMLEFPPSTVQLFGRNLPAAGGGYFRLMPYALSRWLMRRVNQTDGQPCMFYFHPWEIDPEQPRQIGISAKTRFRHYVNLNRMEGRIAHLLRDFEWGRVDQVFLKDAA
jgi:polysaccharide deacetylase family protein (PEP-CTERM system associated)